MILTQINQIKIRKKIALRALFMDAIRYILFIYNNEPVLYIRRYKHEWLGTGFD